MSKMIFVILSLVCMLLLGCEKQYKADGYVPQVANLEVTESKESVFFEFDRGDGLADDDIPKMKKFFRVFNPGQKIFTTCCFPLG